MADPPAPPRWAPPLTLLLALAGLAVSAYLTWVHYAEPRALSCPDTGVVNCTKVTTSPQSMVFGVLPVAVIGVVFFSGMAAVCLPSAWASPRRAVRAARLGGSVAGAAMACYLVGIELLVVHAICLWCTAVHAIALALFVAVLAAHVHLPDEPSPADHAASRMAMKG